jgi:dTDP-4-dehydrorhamnose reductase
MRVLLLGGRGQLATDILRLWTRHEVVPLTHDECDVTDGAAVLRAIRENRPEIVLNCAAYHLVDDCEGEGAMAALAVNVLGARNVADACRQQDAVCLFMSTDYVFDGLAGEPYGEEQPPAPVSIYGVSKAAGEHAVRYACLRHYVVRSSGLYGVAGASGKGGNFVETMLRLARQGETIRVVDDQTLAPTSTADLALALEELVGTGAFGTYHLTNRGACTWREFAAAIFELAGVEADLQPTTTEAYGAPAGRPLYSVLANQRIRDVDIEQPRPWREALAAYLVEKGHREPAPAPR